MNRPANTASDLPKKRPGWWQAARQLPLVLLALILLPGAHAADTATAGRERVDALVQPLLDGELTSGLVVGLVQSAEAANRYVDPSGTAIIGYGQRGVPPAVGLQKNAGEPSNSQPAAAAESDLAHQPPDADTVFEIGSITKPFTGLLLADMIERGEVTLEEPVAQLLPEPVKSPSYEGRPITLLDLVTHTSALPRLPRNLAPADPNDPYADYTREKMFEFLTSYKLRRAPGDRSVYSNYGMALLGEALALRAKSDYASLLHERICAPLGMNDTRIELDAATAGRLTPGHDADGQPSPNWNLAAFAAAGGIRSTARDMVRFVQANLYLPAGATTPGTPATGLPQVSDALRRALALSQLPRHKVVAPAGEIALAWMIQPDGNTVWHNGETGGYHSFTAFDRARGIGVVVLSNTVGGAADELGFRLMKLLSGGDPQPQQVRKPAKIDPAILERYAGRYDVKTELDARAIMTITVEGNRLGAKLEMQPKLAIYPESDSEFFYKAVDAQISFTRNEEGKVTGLVLHQNGKDYAGARLEDK